MTTTENTDQLNTDVLTALNTWSTAINGHYRKLSATQTADGTITITRERHQLTNNQHSDIDVVVCDQLKYIPSPTVDVPEPPLPSTTGPATTLPDGPGPRSFTPAVTTHTANGATDPVTTTPPDAA